MDLDNLRYFLITAEELSLRKAARRLHTSQSTLSRKIQALEEYYGIKAFIRSPIKLELTYEGKCLIKLASELLEDETRLFKKLGNIKEKRPDTISLGIGPSIDSALLLRLLDDFQRSNTSINITLRCGGARDLIKNVQQKEMDILLTCALPDYFLLDGLGSYTLCDSCLTCIAPLNMIEPGLKTNDILGRYNFIHYRTGYQVRSLTDTYLLSRNIKVNSNFSIGEASGINTLVSLKKGIAITPFISAYNALSQKIIEEVKLYGLNLYSIVFNAYFRESAANNSALQLLVLFLQEKLKHIIENHKNEGK